MYIAWSWVGCIIQIRGSADASSPKPGNTWLLKNNGCCTDLWLCCDIMERAWGNAVAAPPPLCERGILSALTYPRNLFLSLGVHDSKVWWQLCLDMPLLLSWISHQKVLSAPVVCVWSSFISCLCVWWKGSATARCVVMKWEGLSFFLILKTTALLEMLSLSSHIC